MAEATRELTVYEVPRPSTRTIRMMKTLTDAGFTVSCVRAPRHSQYVMDAGMRGIDAVLGRSNRTIRTIKQRLEGVKAAEDGTLDARLRSLYTTMLELPATSTRPRWADPGVLADDWLDAASAMVAHPVSVLWAADLDALPAVVWAAKAIPGSRVVFDAHELFPEVDYLDMTLRAEWEEIARTFIPEVDLVLTVGTEIGDELTHRYGARRVEVVHSLAVPSTGAAVDVRSSVGLRDDQPLAVHVGNVSANRRPELAVDLLSAHPELHFAFIGEVRQEQDELVGQRARALGVADRLHFVDPVPVEVLTEFLTSADVSVILYSAETSANLRVAMPNKMFDSLAGGVPVIAADGTAAADYVVGQRLGAAFKDGDGVDLADAVRSVLADNALRAHVRERADEFTWSAAEDRLVEMVTSLAASATSAPVEATADRGEAVSHSQPHVAPLSWSAHPLLRARKTAAWRLRQLAARVDR